MHANALVAPGEVEAQANNCVITNVCWKFFEGLFPFMDMGDFMQSDEEQLSVVLNPVCARYNANVIKQKMQNPN